MITNKLLRECLSQIPAQTRKEFNLSFEIAERIDFLLKKKGVSTKEFAKKMGRKETVISEWLTGRHNFTTQTLAKIANVLGEPIIIIPQ